MSWTGATSAAKVRAFGWHVIEIDGHDMQQCVNALEEAKTVKGQPTAIIAHTIKGKGVSFMEGQAEYHGRGLTPEEYARAMAELGLPDLFGSLPRLAAHSPR